MVIIPVTREVSFHGSLFKATTLTLELFNVIVKQWDLWTINHSPCLKRGKLIQYVSKGLVKAVGECINVVPVYACTKHRRGNISWERSNTNIFEFAKSQFLHDKADREKPIGHWIMKWSEMGKVVLGEARTISSEERVIIKSKVWLDKWVGPETCCERLNVSSRSINFLVSLSRKSSKWRLKSETCCERLNVSSWSINFLVSLSRKSSKWRLKSPEIARASGHIKTLSENWENSPKKTEVETRCNEEYGGRYTITYLIERSCTLTVHSENSKDLFSFPSTNETLRESRNRIPVPPPRLCDCLGKFLKE